MDNDPLSEVLKLKEKASALRNRERYDAALQALGEAERRLHALLTAAAGDERLLALVRAELGDTLGMKGGVHRRRNELEAALADYQAGVRAEGADSKSTYNLGNAVLLSILLQPSSIDDGTLHETIDVLLQRLRAQTEGPRADEWWAWADLAQFELLCGQDGAARLALMKGLSTGPSASEFQRPLDVLTEVGDKLKSAGHPRAAGINSFVAEARLTA